MLFSSENNCNSSIETIIKDKITLIDNNNNNNNNLINLNLNLTSNLNNLNTLSNLSLNQNKLNNNNENASCLHSRTSSPSRQAIRNINPLLLSPLDKENAKEIIQQKILDNVIITQKINEENQELAHYLENINENKINEGQTINSNYLLSPNEYDILSNNSSDLLLNNSNNYVSQNLSVNQFTVQEQNGLFLDPVVFSPTSQSSDDTMNYQQTNELMNLRNLLNGSPNNFIANTPMNTILSPPNSTLLSSPITNTIISSPESNIISSPELYENLSPKLNMVNPTYNDLSIEEYLLNQEIIKLQQEALINNNLVGTVESKVPSSNILMENIAYTANELSPELLNQTLEISETLPLNLEVITNENLNAQKSQKRKIEEDEDCEESEIEQKKTKKEKENIINEGKPFIYVITESDDEDEGNSSDDDQKKKKYKKKFYVCSVCSYKSKRHYNVEVHLKIHEKNRPRPFECDVCKKCFCRAHDLERHKVIHQEKMYECELCGKKFGRLDSLKRHVGCKTCIKRQQLKEEN